MRYFVYFVSGHAQAVDLDGKPYVTPYDCIVRLLRPVTRPDDMAHIYKDVDAQVAAGLREVAPGHRLQPGELPMVRQMNLLHVVDKNAVTGREEVVT